MVFQKAPPAHQSAGPLIDSLSTVNTNLPRLTCTLILAPVANPIFPNHRPFICIHGTVIGRSSNHQKSVRDALRQII